MLKHNRKRHMSLRDRLEPLPRWTRVLVLLSIVAIVVAGIFVGTSNLRIYRANMKELKAEFLPWGEVTADERILVVAPHCDDEALACGAVIHDAVKVGARVHVLLVTNGDGYGEMVRRLERAGPKTYIRFGKKRQQETLDAMRLLGLTDQDVTFLGYPDRGISAMWLSNWTPDNLYTSRYTKCDTSPYANSFRKDAPYCGRALLADLESVILSFRPTSIYYPHPSDQHSDHWGVQCFVQQSIHELRLRPEVREGMYVVHRGDWPVPQGLHPTMRLAPPACLTKLGMEWFGYPLTKEDVALKLRAIRCYKTQLPYMGEYMYSFDRKNELFSTYVPVEIPFIRAAQNSDTEAVWESVTPAMLDPVGDSVKVGFMSRGGDIRAVKCYCDEQNVHVRVELANLHSKRLDYGVSVFGLPDATATRIAVSLDSKGKLTGVGTAVLSGNTFDVTVPLDELGKWDALMVCADSSIEGRKIDRTAWRILLPTGIEAIRKPNPPPALDRPILRTPLAPVRKPL